MLPQRREENAPLEDRLLIEAAVRGDRGAARALYERHREQVWRVVARLVFDPDETKDICQETWLKAFSSLPKFRGESGFATWILRIAVNSAKSRMRSARVRNHVSLEGVTERVEVLSDPSPDQRRTLDDKNRRGALEAALSNLPPKQRQAVVLKYFEGLSYAEIAETMGCRESSVKTHLKRALAALRRTLVVGNR